MTTSGTYAFAPSLGELTLYAYNLCGVRNTALVQEHMSTARMATNLMLSRWANQGVNLWAVDLVEVPLVQGQTTYTVASDTVMVLDAYITIAQGNSNTDRIILPVSRTEYASYPNKEQQGFPTTYWFDRLISPTMTLWPVPDGGQASTLKYYRVRQIQDAQYTSGQNVEIPYLWLEAFALGLAARLAQIWAPSLIATLKPLSDEAYQIAADQNTEYVSQYISPQIQGYFR
tara:strand:+ start:1285 stop:1974 length:690 start_codon:yes stop_codon:yes gene_type:complete